MNPLSDASVVRNETQLFKRRPNSLNAFVRRLQIGSDDDVRRDRRFVWIRNAGEEWDRASNRLLIESLWIAVDKNFYRTLDINLDKARNPTPHFFARRPIWSNHGGDGHDTIPGKK